MMTPQEIDRAAWRIAGQMLDGEPVPFDFPDPEDFAAVMERLQEIVGYEIEIEIES